MRRPTLVGMGFPVSPAFRRFWLARMLSFAGDQIGQVSLVLIAAEHSPAAVGVILLAATLPRLLGPLTGALSDMMSPRRLMVTTDLIQVVLYSTMATVRLSLPALAVCTAIAASLTTIFLPAGRKSYPKLVPVEQVSRAIAAMALCFNIGLAAGPALGGLLALTIGPHTALFLDAASFLLSAILIRALPIGRPEHRAGAAPSYGQTLVAGLRAVFGNRVLLTMSAATFVTIAFAAVENAALPSLSHQYLHLPTSAYAYLVSTFGLGMIAGPVLMARTSGTGRNVRVWLLSHGIYAAAILAIGIFSSPALAFLFQLVAGAGNGCGNVASELLVQEKVDTDALGTASSIGLAIPFAASSLTYATTAGILGVVPSNVLFVIAGSGVMTATLVSWAILSRVEARSAHGGRAEQPDRQDPSETAVRDAARS